MVTFRDLDDPLSVERVDPTDLAATFGPGFALKQVVIEVTDDPFVEILESKLPWLRSLEGSYLDGGSLGGPIALGLFGGQFKAEEGSPP